jgi:hypothetical protein
MSTAEQVKRRERLRDRVEREGLTSCMNDTKWAAVLAAIQAVPGYSTRFRVRLVTDRDDPPDRWEGSFPWHVPTAEFIEWLELDPVVRTPRGKLLPDAREDFSQAITQALRKVRAPFSVENGTLRIWGYLRPGTSPAFVEYVD